MDHITFFIFTIVFKKLVINIPFLVELPRQDKERLIFFASSRVSPTAPDLPTFSHPARSTRLSLPVFSYPLGYL